jgi:DNA-binding transcriptional LysR family regulator
MEFRQLRYFVIAAEERHFGRAADRLHISGQGLGAQIRELEEGLGFELFERMPRGVRLTAAGSALLEDARRILSDVQIAVDHAGNVNRGKAGVLRIGHVPSSAPIGTVGKLVPAFVGEYPEVDVRVTTLSTDEQYGALEQGSIDVGIVYTPPEPPSGIGIEIVEQRCLTGVLLQAGHPLTRNRVLHCADLASLPCLLYPIENKPASLTFFIREMRARGLDVRFDEEHQISDFSMRLSLVAAGYGWMPADSDVASTLPAGTRDLVFRKWAEAPLQFQCSVVWREHDRSAVVVNFVAFCLQLRDTDAAKAVKRLRRV